MATKWKNTDSGTNRFAGLVSWLSLLLLICLAAALLPVTVYLMANPYFIKQFQGDLENAQALLGGDLTQRLVVILPTAGACLLLLGLIALAFVLRRDRKALEDSLARALGRVWVEGKIVGLILWGVLFLGAAYSTWNALVAMPILAAGALLALYFLCLDVGHNRRFFRHNILRSILRWVDTGRRWPSYRKKCTARLAVCLAAEAALLLFGTLVTVGIDRYWWPPVFLVLLLYLALLGAMAGIAVWFSTGYQRDLQDTEALRAQIAEMYGGNLDAANRVSPQSSLFDTAMQLNMIRTGIQKAVEEGTRAERTKIELITNVSHDIKTPLTSIISYVELLKKERDLPAQARDYVNTIAQKADRLSTIVQDVFEVSKAATGNISLQWEELDLSRLLRQTFGEMEETLRSSALTWRVDLPETPVMIRADGQRLYRVFQNLLRNCAQYSLEGSRVYVNLKAQNGRAVVQVRNTSKNELTLDGESLTARFVRGDETRSTEGSGLGLSIAKSFTEACGGVFRVHTDGDLFLVSVGFPLLG